jgi:hypothetical protein
MKLTLAILFSVLSGYALGATPWRTFKSADGSQEFVGELLAYKSGADQATVRLKATMQVTTLELARLSQDDQAYVKAAGPELAPNLSLDLRFSKIMELSGSERDDKTRVKNYNGGYKIEVRNFSTEWIDDVEASYIVIYRKDSTSGSGERVLHSGSTSFEHLIPNVSEEIVADGIELENYYKEGSGSATSQSACSSCPSSGSGSVTRSQKSRDLLLGCIVQFKVAGKVVHTAASSPDILRQYADSFSGSK